MRVLLTGHEGYIGTVLAPLLVRAGHEVVGLDSGLFSDCTYAGEVAAIPSIDKDIRDVARSDLIGFEAVLHLAGLSNNPLGDLNPDLTYDINHKASVRLAECAKAAGVRRFVFSWSCSNYGEAGDDSLDETSPFNPVTPASAASSISEACSHPAASTATCDGGPMPAALCSRQAFEAAADMPRRRARPSSQDM